MVQDSNHKLSFLISYTRAFDCQAEASFALLECAWQDPRRLSDTQLRMAAVPPGASEAA